jgi:hypothetical protein
MHSRLVESDLGFTRVRPHRASVAVLLTMLAVLVAPSLASAHFTRQFLCKISQPISHPAGLTVDSEDHLWVSEVLPGGGESESEPGPGKLYEFEPAYQSCGGSIKSLDIEGLALPLHLAIDNSTGDFYVTGPSRDNESGSSGQVEVFDDTGKFVRRWGPSFLEAYLAVDNSTDLSDPSAGSVYIGHALDEMGPLGDGLPAGVGRFDTEGKPISFLELGFRPGGLTVDSEGNVYTLKAESNEADSAQEFSSAGVLAREFTGNGTPGMSRGRVGHGGFGGTLAGVAVDAVSDHLLVGVQGEHVYTETERDGAIDEFNAATGEFLDQITEAAPGSQLHDPTEISADSRGDLYVEEQGSGEGSSVIDVYGPGRFLPTLTLGEATKRAPKSAALSGTVDPEGLKLTACRFEYVTEVAYRETVETTPGRPEEAKFTNLSSGGEAPCAPAAAGIPEKGATPVAASLSGLTSGVTYRFRLAATSEGALGGTAYSESLAFTAQDVPRVESASVSNISSEFADLSARIDPLGASTTYHFEYSQDGVNWVKEPVPDASIGSGGPAGNAVASVTQAIGGLAPGVTYQFRVVAENAIGLAPGGLHAEGVFTTLAAAAPGLSDGRGYELLTPPNKGDAGDMFDQPLVNGEFINFLDRGFPSESGDDFLLETKAAFGSFPASGKNAYVFSRTGGGWQFAPLASPALGVQSILQPVFDPRDFSEVGIADISGSAASEGGSRQMAVIGPPGGPYTTLTVAPPTHGNAAEVSESGEPTIVGASHDLGHVILEGADHSVCPGSGREAEKQDPGSRVLCEWDGSQGSADGTLGPELKLVNVENDGTLVSRCGATLGQGDRDGGMHNAVSQDGSQVLFTAPDPLARGTAGCWNGGTVNAPQLYLRLHGETIELSAPQEGVEEEPAGDHLALYAGASEDGSKVFFISETELTKEAVELKLHDPELYECEIVETTKGHRCKLTRISAGEPGSPARGLGTAGAHVLTVPVVSANGAAVYFTARSQLAGDAPELGGEAVNVYRYDTLSGTTRYVTTVNEVDYVSNVGFSVWSNFGQEGIGDAALMSQANWYTTPDGRYLLFATGREITGYNTINSCSAGSNSQFPPNGHCYEVYRYDAEAAERQEQAIVCVSCNPSGARPTSNSLFERSAPENASSGPVPAMSDNGAYVFFDTADALVPQDDNHTLDVYEWHEGRISLISSGQDSAPSYFLGESPNVTSTGEQVEAGNVFFGTHARLVPQDTDSDGDLYDARSAGGFPTSGTGTGVCEGDACVNVPSMPIDSTPVSLTFSGPGNLAAPLAAGTEKKKAEKKAVKCSKPKRSSHGKCTRPKSKGRTQAKAKKTSDRRRGK